MWLISSHACAPLTVCAFGIVLMQCGELLLPWCGVLDSTMPPTWSGALWWLVLVVGEWIQSMLGFICTSMGDQNRKRPDAHSKTWIVTQITRTRARGLVANARRCPWHRGWGNAVLLRRLCATRHLSKRSQAFDLAHGVSRNPRKTSSDTAWGYQNPSSWWWWCWAARQRPRWSKRGTIPVRRPPVHHRIVIQQHPVVMTRSKGGQQEWWAIGRTGAI